MKMIDVMKRLAELDSQNPNIVKEGADIAECGPMGIMGGMGQSHTPASVNITAGSGEELSAMLKDIMSLAGLSKVEPDHMGIEQEPMTLTAEPVVSVGPIASAGDEMRSVIDKMNPMDDEEDEKETAEGQYDNSPSDPRDVPSIDHDAMLNKSMQNQDQAGHPGGGDRMDGDRPKAFATLEAQLMDEYRNFVTESEQLVAESSGLMINGKEVDMQSLEIDGVDTRDYPDFSDAYISRATFVDGAELHDLELEQLNDEHGDLVNQLAYDSLHENVGRKQGVAESRKPRAKK